MGWGIFMDEIHSDTDNHTLRPQLKYLITNLAIRLRTKSNGNSIVQLCRQIMYKNVLNFTIFRGFITLGMPQILKQKKNCANLNCWKHDWN